MPVPSWPQGKGKPLSDGFRYAFPDLARRSEVDAGPAKQNRRGVATPAVVQIAYVMTTAEWTWLESFYRVDAAGGAVWFDWWYPVGLATCPARFLAGSPPVVEPKRPGWLVGVTLEVRL